MGGIACQVERKAMLQFATVPRDQANPEQIKEFDKQLRACFTLSEIAVAIEGSSDWQDVCSLLSLPSWNHDNRVELLGYLEGIWSKPPASSVG